ncbi:MULTISPECIES: PKD-like domain-containing protein [Odoribacteraceae]|uniref:PKD-like domain-containing protein n=1 Tax=Odoribacteraceae TaxID=1853231 RepID=UPI0013142472|nr:MULTISPECIES: PKD-like domain-containing protein [Odoribacteraceae]MCQ4875760.1 hypothetical protein [Butyricimonas paravirosa]
MRKDVQLKFVLLMMLFVGAFMACDDDDEKIDVGNPDFVFNSETGEYNVRIGKEVALCVHVKDALNPVYAWKQEGKIVADDTVYYFKGETLGECFVNFRLDADNGSVEKQVKVTVVDRLSPQIKLETAAVAYCGIEREIAAETEYTDETTTFEWSYGGRVVSHDSVYMFKEEDINVYTLALKVTNEDGVDVKNINVSVIPEEEPLLFFDNARYVLPSMLDKAITMTCPIGKHVVLAPVKFAISDQAVYEWKVDGQVQSGQTSVCFDFTPSVEGKTYEIDVTATDNGKTASTKVYVQCTPKEGTYFRQVTSRSNYISNHCFEFIPAPGQFIRFTQNQTAEDARRQIQTSLDNGGGTSWIASLGAWGGYFILGFDHSVEDDGLGEADFDIVGNPLGKYWCECGVVWVSQDENGNGIPDDTWYELKGSETGKPGITQRYALKYYRPTAEKQDVLSIDNDGNLSFLARNAYHPDSGYYPWFMKEEYYILTGTCLGNQFKTEGLETNWGFDWGYVDNINDPAGFRIENAIQQDGSPANLKYIDFVKVHTAQMGQGAAVGEVSTESSAAMDLRLKAKK